MTPAWVLRLLEDVAAGVLAPAAAAQRLEQLGAEELADVDGTVFARVDHHRALRLGHPEVVFCEGKTSAQVLEICRALAAGDGGFLATRASAEVRSALAAQFAVAEVNDIARTVHLPGSRADSATDPGTAPRIAVVSAGTSDLPVAEEAAVAAAALGNPVDRLYDVGVAGLHRVLAHTDRLRDAGVVVVVAGMEGALPSVVGGLVDRPVIAVPTSVGYGASFGGLAALLAMLNSCSAGITVVNIDNGFGAAVAATRICRRLARNGCPD
jgi:pyridinium-3,5-biscarboxylic acid mononucleotide synthase